MNSWQIKYIQENLASLIRVTSCTESFKACLVSKGLLDDEEVQNITLKRKYSGDIPTANKLYSILQTRTGGFFGLMDALKETRQTGAWNILRSGIQEKLSSFPVKICGEILPLNELFTSWTNEDSVNCLDSENTMTEFCKLLSDDTKVLDVDNSLLNNTPHPLYIPRFVSNRALINVSAFKQTCKDVFVFKGIEKYELGKLVDPHPVRSSSSQLTMITCRHIYLEVDEDWDDLREATKAPLHLISKEDGEYVLQRCTQITDTILNHSAENKNDKEAYIPEDQFATEISSNPDTKCICICDLPGMGNTWLLENVGKKLQTLSVRTLVLFIPLSSLGKSLGELQVPNNDPLGFILEVFCSSKLVSCILKSGGKRSSLKTILVLDGFDEIREDYVDITTTFLKKLVTEDNIRLVVSSRPRMRKHLEKTFKVTSYDILPFEHQEQVNVIVGQWLLNIEDRESKLRDYAEQCIRVVRDIQCKDSKHILGAPLKCYLLAEVNHKYANQIARNRRGLKVPEEALIKSTCDLYEKFVESRTNKVLELGPDPNDLIERLSYFHTHQALKLLMPTELPFPVECYFSEKYSPQNTIEEVALKIGIMSLDSNSQFVFLHRSFAEYFAGKFFAEFWENLDQFEHSFVRYVGHYFVKNLLNSRRRYHCGLILAKFDTEWFFTPDKHKQKISWFLDRTILWFMNSLCRAENTVVTRLREAMNSETSSSLPDTDFTQFKMMLTDHVFGILLTCIDEKFRAILSLFLKITQVFFDPFELFAIIVKTEHGIPTLLHRIAASGFPETAHEIFELFSHWGGKLLAKLLYSVPVGLCLTVRSFNSTK